MSDIKSIRELHLSIENLVELLEKKHDLRGLATTLKQRVSTSVWTTGSEFLETIQADLQNLLNKNDNDLDEVIKDKIRNVLEAINEFSKWQKKNSKFVRDPKAN